ncbi:sodium:solute symporter [Candidatus Sumerlaeota bacterium]
MRTLDWIIFAAYLIYIIGLGSYRSRGSRDTRDYFLAGRSLPWWMIGLSVMATQASAITFIGTTGLGYEEGMRFVQFYFGLPVAMVILCVTLVPLFYRAKVYTAYEYLEQRFDAKTRLLTSILFLISRGLALGIVVYAPSVVLAILLGWDIWATVLIMAVAATIYTVVGGIRAVIWTDVQQMILIAVGMFLCVVIIYAKLPDDVSLLGALKLAGSTDRLQPIDFSFDLTEKYTFWSGLFAGTFLMLSYFGCDQSQVQRYLTSRSLRDSRLALLFNAFLKVPMQFFILFIGVLLFAFYQFEKPPLAFDDSGPRAVRQSDFSAEYDQLETRYDAAFEKRKQAAREFLQREQTDNAESSQQALSAYSASNKELADIRQQSAGVIKKATGKSYKDTNYIFPRFVIHHLPVGLVGLIIAAVFAAAMSSMDSELNSLSTTSVIDIYRRHLKPDADERHYLKASRVCTVIWAVIAGSFAMYAGALGSVIEAVNIVGSYFYGSLLGVFVLAVCVKRANGNGAFWGLLAGMTAVCVASLTTDIAFLWFNIVGCAAVVAVGFLLRGPAKESPQ